MITVSTRDELPFIRVVIPLDLLRIIERHLLHATRDKPCKVCDGKPVGSGCTTFLCPDDEGRYERLVTAICALGCQRDTALRIAQSESKASADLFPRMIGGLIAKLTTGTPEQPATWQRLAVSGSKNSLAVLREVLVPEVFESLFDPPPPLGGTSESLPLPEVAWLRLREDVPTLHHGSLVSLKRGSRRGCQGILAVESIDLIVATTGVALACLDFHLVAAGRNAAANEKGDPEALRQAAVEVVDLLQYLPSRHRQDMSPSFVDATADLALMLADGHLPGRYRPAVQSKLAKMLEDSLVVGSDGLSTRAKNAANAARGVLSKALFQTSWAADWLRHVWSARAERSRPSSGSDSRDGWREALTSWTEHQLGPDSTPPLRGVFNAEDGAELWAEVRALLLAEFSALHDDNSSAMKGLRLARNQEWNYTTILENILSDAGLRDSLIAPGQAETTHDVLWDAVLTAGDRAFIFTHLLSFNELSPKDDHETLLRASRLATGQGRSHPPPTRLANGLDAEVSSSGVRVLHGVEAVRHTLALEGVCVEQGGQLNPEFSANSDVIRLRQFSLVVISLLARLSLLRLSIHLTTVPPSNELDEIRQFVAMTHERVARIKRTLLLECVSQMTHLQQLHEKIRDVFEIHGMWSAAQLNLTALENTRVRALEREESRRRAGLEAEHVRERKAHELAQAAADQRRARIERIVALVAGSTLFGSLADYFIKIRDGWDFIKDPRWEVFATGAGLLVICVVAALALARWLDRPASERADRSERE